MGSSERPGVGATGSAGARGAFLLILAFVLGVLILQKFDDGGSAPFSGSVSAGGTTTPVTPTTRRPSVSVLPATTTRALRPNEQVKVLPANATDTQGLATKVGTLLTANNYNALAPTDATKKVDNTLVEYKPDLEPEARALAQLLVLPASSLRPMEDAPPVGDARGADIIVIIGPDLRVPEATPTTKK